MSKILLILRHQSASYNSLSIDTVPARTSIPQGFKHGDKSINADHDTGIKLLR